MARREPTVFVVDDDEAVRDALALLMKSAGLPVVTHGTAREFLESHGPDPPGCLLLDIRMKGMSGIDLQRELDSSGSRLPIIFITGHAETTVDLGDSRHVDVVEKPFDDEDLLGRIRRALAANEGPAPPGKP